MSQIDSPSATPRRTEGALSPQQRSAAVDSVARAVPWFGPDRAEAFRRCVVSLAALSQPWCGARVISIPPLPPPLGSTIITRFVAPTGALTPADLFPTVHRGSLIHVTLTSCPAISNHLDPSSSRDPLPQRGGLSFVWTSSFLRRLVTDTGRIEFPVRRTLPSRRSGREDEVQTKESPPR